MGAAASAADKLDLDAVKALAGDKFDQAKFDELKDENGYVTKEALLGLARKGRYSFRTFTPATAKGGASIDPSRMPQTTQIKALASLLAALVTSSLLREHGTQSSATKCSRRRET